MPDIPPRSNLPLSELRSHWKALKKSEDDRQKLFERMFDEMSQAMSENGVLQERVKDLEHLRDNFATQNRRLCEGLNALKDKLNASPFVLVLVDGDSALFLDELVAAGSEGGHTAAQQLKGTLEAYGRESLGLQPHWNVIVRIYVNKTGLVKTYKDANIVPKAQVVENFIIGFNRELPFVELIDAGPDKEAADNKIKENFGLYWPCVNCKHIMLAGSADQGYVNFLRRFSDIDQSGARLTLIKSVPFPASFRQLASRFPVTTFACLFRDTKIVVPSRAVQSGAMSYAGATSQKGASSITPHSSSSIVPNRHTSATSQSTANQRNIRFNKRGQRLDDPLPQCDKSVLELLRKQHLCRRFFLTRCSRPGCAFSHAGELSSEHKRALTRLAKETPCSNGSTCDDKDCVAAHECVYRDRCDWRSECRYGEDMHNVDRVVARRVLVRN